MTLSVVKRGRGDKSLNMPISLEKRLCIRFPLRPRVPASSPLVPAKKIEEEVWSNEKNP
jgi:hypothetical protein